MQVCMKLTTEPQTTAEWFAPECLGTGAISKASAERDAGQSDTKLETNDWRMPASKWYLEKNLMKKPERFREL